jgi:hypothetical protein
MVEAQFGGQVDLSDARLIFSGVQLPNSAGPALALRNAIAEWGVLSRRAAVRTGRARLLRQLHPEGWEADGYGVLSACDV